MNGNSQFWWTAEPGSHEIRFVVDADNHLEEGDESNNEKSVIVEAGSDSAFIDLLPAPITFNESQLVPGKTVFFDTGIRNAGNTASGAFNIKWFVDGEQLGYGSHSGVPAGSTVMGGNSQFWWEATPGEHEIVFVVDADNHSPEANERNNRATVKVNVISP